MRKILGITKPSPAMFIAVAALGVGLAGGASAATGLITGDQVKDNSITGADIKNRSVKAQDLAPSARVASVSGLPRSQGAAVATGAQGPQGRQGPAGPAGPQGAQGSPGRDAVRVVTAPGGGFTASNPLGHFSAKGFSFGPFTDSGDQGASLIYRGADIQGMELRDIAELTYSAGFNGTSNDPPFLRVFLDNNGDGFTGGPDDHDVAFVPFSQPGGTAGTAGRLIEYDVTEGELRYDDDPGSLPEQTWDQVLAAHGTDKIDAFIVTGGFSLPGTTDAFLNSLRYEVAGSPPSVVSFSN